MISLSHIAQDKFYIEPRDQQSVGDQILEIDRVTQELSLAGRLDIVLIKGLYEFFKCYKLDLRCVPVVVTFWPQQWFRSRKLLNHKIVRDIIIFSNVRCFYHSKSLLTLK